MQDTLPGSWSFFSRQPSIIQTTSTTANTLPTIATDIKSGDPTSQPIKGVDVVAVGV